MRAARQRPQKSVRFLRWEDVSYPTLLGRTGAEYGTIFSYRPIQTDRFGGWVVTWAG